MHFLTCYTTHSCCVSVENRLLSTMVQELSGLYVLLFICCMDIIYVNGCRSILANGQPWISLDICFNRFESGEYKSVITSCHTNKSAIDIKIYNGTDCNGIIINQTIQEYDSTQLQCDGSLCSHAIIRNYDSTNCDRSGDYTEFPFPVKQCFILPRMASYFGSVRFNCNDTGVYTQIYPLNIDNCDRNNIAKETVAWDEYGECNDDYQWSQFIKCKASYLQISWIFHIISMFIIFENIFN